MILQALKEYYDRKAADPDSGIAPLGWEWKEIPYLIVLREDGTLVRVEDTQDSVRGKKYSKLFLVPQEVKRSGKNFSPNILWDKTEYVLGVSDEPTKDTRKKHENFIDSLDRYVDIPDIKVVVSFLKRAEALSQLKNSPSWSVLKNGSSRVSFRIEGRGQPVFRTEQFVCRYNELLEPKKSIRGICSIDGKIDFIPNTHPKIIGVLGTDKGRGDIVSFNWKAACSFGKEQNFNASIGYQSAFAYTTALNTLLGKDSRQKMQVGDATTVFWSEKPTELEDEFLDLFGEPEKDDPDTGVVTVVRLLSSVRPGSFSHEDETTRFYVLGLAPNAARISVRFWHNGTVAEMERRFADWFENLRIAHGPRDKEHLSLQTLLLSIARYNKDRQKWKENIPPNLGGAVMRSILEGTPYPATLLSSAILRIKAEHEVSYPRAKLIKAFLNHNLNNERKLTVSLDKENANIGYRLGRLFAVLEKIQEEANPGLNATIRDKFYASASSTPNAVYGNLMRLKNHHLGKLSQGRSIYFEKLLGEVISEIPSFPAHLSLDDQGGFAIGYYHQRQDFFTGKQTKSDSDGATNGVGGSVQTESSL